MRKLGVLAAADSAVKYCYLLASEYARPGDVIEIVCLRETGRDVSAQILSNMGVSAPFRIISLADFLSHEALSYDVLFIFPEQRAVYCSFLNDLHTHIAKTGAVRRPLLVVGFIGIAMDYLLKGLALRQGADVICVNTKHDYQQAQQISHKMGFDSSVLVKTGYPMAIGEKRQAIRTQPNSGRRIVFATQPHWPGLLERKYIIARLLKGCQRCPDDRFIIKLRLPEGKKSVHNEPYHYQRLFKQMDVSQPANLEFAYGSMQEVLDETDVLVTVSSTAAVESIARGIPTAILSDFGYSTDYGLHHFIGSGLLRSLEQVIDGDIGTPRNEWLEENGFGHDDDRQALHARLDALLLRQSEQGQPLPLHSLCIGKAHVPFEAVTYQQLMDDLVRSGFLKRKKLSAKLRWLYRHQLPQAVRAYFPAHTGIGRGLRSAVHKWRAFRDS